MSSEARLRIDPGDDLPVTDYRLVNRIVEVRILGPGGRINACTGSPWRQLKPQELAAHVEAKTAVAHWLERRMGVRLLLQACLDRDFGTSQPFSQNEGPTRAA